MKHVILFICLAIGIGTSAFSQDTKQDKFETKVISLDETFTFLSVDNGINIVLTEGLSDEIHIEGDARDIQRIRTTINDGSLFISSIGHTEPGLKVYVPAQHLRKINIYGSSVLQSASVLKNPKLKIVLAGEARISVRSSGKVIVEPTDEYRFVTGR